MERRLRDRSEAGQLLAEKLTAYADRTDVIVLALPRGGVSVAFEVARALKAPLDIFIVRKLGVPWQPELAMGAIATGGVMVLNGNVVRAYRLSDYQINSVAAQEQQELERRERAYRGSRPAPNVRGRTVILVDDGIATGMTMRAAIAALRKLGPARIVVAVPVGPRSTFNDLKTEADDVVYVLSPEVFQAVGSWYEQFPQLTNGEVSKLLERAAGQAAVANKQCEGGSSTSLY